jgi:release factor glutamine methyltransferase
VSERLAVTVGERIAEGRRTLAGAGIPDVEAALDADVLARSALGLDRAAVLARMRDPEPDAFARRFTTLVQRRARREPVAYITGEREFWGLPFEVGPDVLIPRPETELIVEEALAAFAGGSPASIIDVCTGSGCLAVALAREFPDAHVIATDISESALKVARRNAERHAVEGRIDFRQADLLAGVAAQADLLVCNPPYVAARDAETLPPDVRDYEPHLALFAGEDGLQAYRRLFPTARSRMKPGGRLIVEVGYDQHPAIQALAASLEWRLFHARSDLQGIVRTLVFVGAEP